MESTEGNFVKEEPQDGGIEPVNVVH